MLMRCPLLLLLISYGHTDDHPDCVALLRTAWRWLGDRQVPLDGACGAESDAVAELVRCWATGEKCLTSGPFRMAGLLDSQWPIAEVLEEVERSSLEPEILRSKEARRLSWNAVLRGRGSAMVEALAVVDGAEDDSEAKVGCLACWKTSTCRKGPAQAVGLAMAADALTCHALTRGRLSARRGLTMILDWLGPLNASLSVHSGWPLFALLSRIRKANGLPAIESAMVVSWSSEEAAHLGGNFAETMARHIFGAVDGAVVKADVECADVWIFREHPPVNFGGVAIFVDGETHWKNSGIHSFPAYDLGIYLGPQDHGMAFGDRFFYAPFASTSFAQRKDAAMDQLLHGARLALWDNKTKFAAYLSHNCASKSRERFYLALLRAASAFGLEVEALSRCNGSGVPHELGRRGKRYSSSFYDDAVEIYKPYKFVVAMENRVAPGYVTEKIVNAFLAGAIPIYYGDSAAQSIFNPASFIDLADFNDFEEAAKTVVEIALDESAARKYVEEPVFSTTNGSYSFSWHAVASEAFPNGGLAGDVRGRVARLSEQAGSEGNVLARLATPISTTPIPPSSHQALPFIWTVVDVFLVSTLPLPPIIASSPLAHAIAPAPSLAFTKAFASETVHTGRGSRALGCHRYSVASSKRRSKGHQHAQWLPSFPSSRAGRVRGL